MKFNDRSVVYLGGRNIIVFCQKSSSSSSVMWMAWPQYFRWLMMMMMLIYGLFQLKLIDVHREWIEWMNEWVIKLWSSKSAKNSLNKNEKKSRIHTHKKNSRQFFFLLIHRIDPDTSLLLLLLLLSVMTLGSN